jgi:hypothetical protein
MKDYVAVVSHDAGRVTKFQDFDTQADADTHVVNFGGFVANNPGDDIGYWVIADNTLTYDTAQETADAADITATQYRRDRDYGSIQDQLDMIYWDGVNDTTVWTDHVAAVKAAHPKPE